MEFNMDISGFCKEIENLSKAASKLEDPAQIIKAMIKIVEVCKNVVDIAATIDDKQEELQL